MTRTKL